MLLELEALGTRRRSVGSDACSSNWMVQEPDAMKMAKMDDPRMECFRNRIIQLEATNCSSVLAGRQT